MYQRGRASKKSDNPNSSIKRAQEHSASQHHMDPLDPKTRQPNVCQCINGILTRPHCYNQGENCGKVAREKKGDANCVCHGGTFTGAGCPYIGHSCYDPHAELNQGAVTRYPVSHPGKTHCPPGEMLVNIGALCQN